MATMEQYAAARAAYNNAASVLEGYASALETVSQHLRRTRYFSFSNTGTGLPIEFMSGPSFDAKQLPSAETMQQGIANKAATHRAMLDAWHSLPKDQQSVMQAPPGA